MSISHSSRTTPRTSASHGRIVTQNSTLSASLRENSDVIAAPASSTSVSVRQSSALDVVSSHAIVSNASTNPITTTSPSISDVQYVVVSKSRLSLNTDVNINSNTERDAPVVETPKEEEASEATATNDSNIHVSDGVTNDVTDDVEPQPDSEVQVNSVQTLDEPSLPDTARSNKYKYQSLKSSETSKVHKQGSFHRGTSGTLNLSGDGTQQALNSSGDGTQQALSDHNNSGVKQIIIVDSNTESETGAESNRAYINSRLKNQTPGVREARNSYEKEISSHFQEEELGPGTLHEHSNTHEHSFLVAPQHTSLSLNSQHDRVSRDRVPFQLDDQDKTVPPLNLNSLSREQTLDNISQPSDSPPPPISSQRSDLYLDDQKLHASDRKTSLTHFSTTRDNHPSGRRTYEVESPVLSNSLPHIKSYADNFREEREAVHIDDQDTYRDRQQEPDKLEPNPSDLADDLNVPFPFDTQAQSGGQSRRSVQPPSPPVQTTPPPGKEPATSLRSSSQVYAVADPDIQRAQGRDPGPNSYGTPRDFSHRSEAGEVRFDSASQRPQSYGTRADSKLRDRAPTPYAKSPEREDLPTTPPNWDPPRESRESSRHKRGSAASKSSRSGSKQGLPPQHPPLSTHHNTPKPGSRGTKNEDSQSVKRVYVESPSFTKEEEDEYRFVNSRLDDIEDKHQTFREMDHSRRGYGGDDNPTNTYADVRSRKTDSEYDRRAQDKNRYEDRMNDRYDDRNNDRMNNGYEDRRDRTRDLDNRYDDRNKSRSVDKDPIKDRYEDRTREMNGYSDYNDRDRDPRGRGDRGIDYRERDDRGRDNRGRDERDRGRDERDRGRDERDRGRDERDRGRDDREMRYDDGSKYRAGDDRYQKYDRLRDERDEFEHEPRREDDPNIRGYKKQNTEMDEQELRKEAEYQKSLKQRLDKNKVRADKENRDVRRDSYEKEYDYRRDSLEYPDDREGGRGYARDSIDYNNYEQQQDWDNPPQNPYQEGQYYQQQPDYVKQDSKPDFYDAEDVERMDLVNPKAPKFDYVEKNKYDYGMHERKTYRGIVHRKKEEEEKLDHVFITPKVPSKDKKKAAQKAQSAQPQHMGYQPPPQHPMGFKPSSAEEVWQKRAQILSHKKDSAQGNKPVKGSASKKIPRWNSNPQVKQAFKMEAPPPLPNASNPYRSSNAYQLDHQTSQDQGGYSQSQGGYGSPTRQLQPLENKPAAPVSTELMPTAVNPASPFRRHMELKPITQEITTEDGQRISVDINLRLISPPPGQSGNTSPQQQQQLALVPVQETQGPMDQRGLGVPYQMQDNYGHYDNGYGGYADIYKRENAGGSKSKKRDDKKQQKEPLDKRKMTVSFGDHGQYNDGYQQTTEPLQLEMRYDDARLTEEELALADPSSYSKKYQAGSVSFKDEQGSNAEQKTLEAGYAALYHKMKSKDPSEHPWYKVYNLDDYKKMQREVRLNRGTLGPDLDTESYKDKMEKRHKQFEYARTVMEKNRVELGSKKPPKFPRSPEKQGEEGVKRKTALEYAKNVPRPSVKQRPNQYNSYEVAAQMSPGSSPQRSQRMKASPQPTQTMDVIDIRTLEQRHIQERKNTDKIRQNMDSVLSQKAH